MVCNIVRLLFLLPQNWTSMFIPQAWSKIIPIFIWTIYVLAFDICRSVEDLTCLVISPEIHSPLLASVWETELLGHPDRAYVKYILQGLNRGFRMGLDRRQHISSASGNLHIDKPEVVTDYLQWEVLLGSMWKIPLMVAPRGVHYSPLGIIPKRNKPGKWRLVVDLSSPQGMSINDGIDTDRSSLSYPSMDHLTALVVSTGRGGFLVKADIREVYRMMPVHLQDQHLLGVQWESAMYIDKVLPFGLRSVPKIFSAVADTVQWILYNKASKKDFFT